MLVLRGSAHGGYVCNGKWGHGGGFYAAHKTEYPGPPPTFPLVYGAWYGRGIPVSQCVLKHGPQSQYVKGELMKELIESTELCVVASHVLVLVLDIVPTLTYNLHKHKKKTFMISFM